MRVCCALDLTTPSIDSATRFPRPVKRPDLSGAFLLAVAVSLTVPRDGAAQTPANQDSVWAAAFARLSPGRAVRVHHTGSGRIEGRFRGAAPARLTLDVAASPTELATAGLDSLWIRGNAARTGALVGAIPGALAGVTLGVIANNVGCRDGGDPCPEAVPLLGLGGAAAGALVGALIGSSIPKWHRRIP
jgi:hypothetical protein